MFEKPVLLFLVLAVSGCTSLPPVSPHQSTYGVEIRGEVAPEQVKEVDSFLAKLNLRVLQSINSLCYYSSFDSFYKDHSFGAIGYCHWNRHICIVGQFFTDPATLWHEIGHAYAFYWEWSFVAPLRLKWERAAGNVYGEDRYKYHYPGRGVLTLYGTTNYKEDIAEWFSEVMLYLSGMPSAIATVKVNGDLYKDPYLGKLKIFKEYGFITKEEYNRILKK